MNLLTVEEVATTLLVSKTTVRDLCRSGRLVAYKIGSQWRVSDEQLADYLESCATSTALNPASDVVNKDDYERDKKGRTEMDRASYENNQRETSHAKGKLQDESVSDRDTRSTSKRTRGESNYRRRSADEYSLLLQRELASDEKDVS